MTDREKYNELIRKLLVGPYPLENFCQEDGEEILFVDSPLKTYVAGVLFPQEVTEESVETEPETNEDSGTQEEIDDIPDDTYDDKGASLGSDCGAESDIDIETARINSYKQSAMGITVCIPFDSSITVSFSAAKYEEKSAKYPVEKLTDDNKHIIEQSAGEKKCYFRKKKHGEIVIDSKDLPNTSDRFKTYSLIQKEGGNLPGVSLSCTFRMKVPMENCGIFTFTILNMEKGSLKNVLVKNCWFQTAFEVALSNETSFIPLPDNYCENIDDVDYQLNSMLYRNVRTYGIGHGCAATWKDDKSPCVIRAEVMPEYDVKPIVPSGSKAKLSMKDYMSNVSNAVADLSILCDEYQEWIDKRVDEIESWRENKESSRFIETATEQIDKCRFCLDRMRRGIKLLSGDSLVAKAFCLMNKAMLMQQLHYKLPLREFSGIDDDFSYVLNDDIVMPDPENESTWYGDKSYYGKWRPFQIAFILMNLYSVNFKDSDERKLVDLIWFPTGGGKTEAYLGLTAFTILLRRLKNPVDAGTAVVMRYTLRLLTSQQFSRAASLIASLERIRLDNIRELGSSRITIGLWIGHKMEESKISDIKKKLDSIHNGKLHEEPGVVLKCPWCGSSMRRMGDRTPGYDFSIDNKRIVYRCGNPECEFSDDDDAKTLPFKLLDEEIYNDPPTLLFGTVDKFATIPFRPESKCIFGGDHNNNPPELFIQDELHLITGPLGSTVGLYETMISELCKQNGYLPKLIASTATIRHAKQQCNSLYACGEDKVFQFPVQGLQYDDCFFAKEDLDKAGRTYIGLFGNAASSATTSIFAFAAELYAGYAFDAISDRDPYYTNLAYFNSMRELGQAATWLSADIRERLETIYESRLLRKSKDRRYIYDNKLAELTSRMDNEDIPDILQRLENRYDSESGALDICLATNMVSVGVDVPRLGLMTLTGQPKSMSEYIQATSRVGRNKPGTVLVIYNTSKPRDKSHYERFQSQHSRLYFSVEPTSVTPFSRPLRERALAAIFVGLFRMMYSPIECRPPKESEFEVIRDIIINRVQIIDSNEKDDTLSQLNDLYEEWKYQNPQKYDCSMIHPDESATLIYRAGVEPPSSWGNRGWAIPNSMRNVDRECRLDCSKVL